MMDFVRTLFTSSGSHVPADDVGQTAMIVHDCLGENSLKKRESMLSLSELVGIPLHGKSAGNINLVRAFRVVACVHGVAHLSAL